MQEKKYMFIPRHGKIEYKLNSQKEILEEVLKVKLGFHIPSLKELFLILPANSSAAIRKKIKKANKTKIEKILISYYEKYKIKLIQPKKKIQKKESKEAILARVQKHREKDTRVSLQIKVSILIKNKFNTLKKETGLNSEELLIKMLKSNIYI